mmetsp:Transcript_33308/g.91859  ORF Transcript_33308/g.91859 Transcript_33308/m.91859 type:complete len:552 (-) Transcript_33308:64-1719(-)
MQPSSGSFWDVVSQGLDSMGFGVQPDRGARQRRTAAYTGLNSMLGACSNVRHDDNEGVPLRAAERLKATPDDPAPCVDEPPMLEPSLIVTGAGTATANGIYRKWAMTFCGRPIWVKLGDCNHRIQWSAGMSHWMIDYVLGDAPYCIGGRSDLTVPLDAVWQSYQNGRAPMPTVQFAEVEVATQEEMLGVFGAGVGAVNGVYKRCSELIAARPSWTKVDDDNYKIHWSVASASWHIDYGPGDAVYFIDGCTDATLPLDAKWVCCGDGKEPAPIVQIPNFMDSPPACEESVVVSGAGNTSANGVYKRWAVSQGRRSIWAKVDDTNYRIQWSNTSSQWIIDHVLGDAPYCVVGYTDRMIPLDATWKSYQGGAPPMPSVTASDLDAEMMSQPESVTVVGAGSAEFNGVYNKWPVVISGRAVWTKVDNSSYRIQWSAASSQWIMDSVRGDAPYCIKGRSDIALPLDAVWECYQGGKDPMPTLHIAATAPPVVATQPNESAQAGNEGSMDLLGLAAEPSTDLMDVSVAPVVGASPSGVAASGRAPDASGPDDLISGI